MSRSRRVVWSTAAFLILVVLVFAVMRITEDAGNLAAGVVPPPDDFASRYARVPWLAYLHIVPGLVYLVLAPLQFSARRRERSIETHRKRGRVLLGLGLVSGVFGIAFGIPFSFGGAVQAAATVVFGAWFVYCLVRAYRAIRGLRVTEHRRWMIRAFAIGLGVGTIRIWVGLFQGFGLLSFRDSFGIAFWLAFSMHLVAAEVWLARHPEPVSVDQPVNESR